MTHDVDREVVLTIGTRARLARLVCRGPVAEYNWLSRTVYGGIFVQAFAVRFRQPCM